MPEHRGRREDWVYRGRPWSKLGQALGVVPQSVGVEPSCPHCELTVAIEKVVAFARPTIRGARSPRRLRFASTNRRRRDRRVRSPRAGSDRYVPRRSSPTTSGAASRPSSRNAQGTFSVSATCLDTVTRRLPISTFMRAAARRSRSFWDNIWDKSTAGGKDAGKSRTLTHRNHSSARNRTRTCTP